MVSKLLSLLVNYWSIIIGLLALYVSRSYLYLLKNLTLLYFGFIHLSCLYGNNITHFLSVCSNLFDDFCIWTLYIHEALFSISLTLIHQEKGRRWAQLSSSVGKPWFLQNWTSVANQNFVCCGPVEKADNSIQLSFVSVLPQNSRTPFFK